MGESALFLVGNLDNQALLVYPNINRLDSVTRHPVLATNVPQFWLLLLTDVNCHTTSRVETATRGGINRAGYITS